MRRAWKEETEGKEVIESEKAVEGELRAVGAEGSQRTMAFLYQTLATKTSECCWELLRRRGVRCGL